jgi:uncharacterized phage-associated protein
MNAKNLAAYILKKFEHAPVTPLKLQKLLFYTKVWGIVAEKDLVEGDFEKWEYGPVNPEVYHAYKVHDNSPIPAPDYYVSPPQGKEKALIDFILEAYMPYSAIALSSMTHEEEPWKETPEGDVISSETIYDYYSTHPFAKNLKPFNPDHGPYYPVQTDLWHSFVMDMNQEDAESGAVYDSFETFKEEMSEAKKDTQEMLHDWLNE